MKILRFLRKWWIKNTTVPALDGVMEWVVNEYGELGVKIGNRVGFLYKGYFIEYEDGLKDDGTPLRYRHVYKREFGECCISPLYRSNPISFASDAEWKPLPKQLWKIRD